MDNLRFYLGVVTFYIGVAVLGVIMVLALPSNVPAQVCESPDKIIEAIKITAKTRKDAVIVYRDTHDGEHIDEAIYLKIKGKPIIAYYFWSGCYQFYRLLSVDSESTTKTLKNADEVWSRGAGEDL